MTYTPPVNQTAINKAEERFWRLIAIAVLVFVGLGTWWWLDPGFWSGHKIWTSGAALIVLSVIHTKYFDIRRASNPQNQRFDPANAGKISPVCRIVEELVKVAWIVGFILVGISRWIHV